MPTPLKRAPVALPGAPYMTGDPVFVEFEGSWVRGHIDGMVEATAFRFGQRWVLTVSLRELGHTVNVTCDDNGRCHTYRKQVCPAPFDEVLDA